METFRFGKAVIEDTHAEASDGLYCRLLITGERGLTKKDTYSPLPDYDPLRDAALRFASTPATVVNRTEAGIERWLPKSQTPDGREGAVVQIWAMYNNKKPLKEQVEMLNEEMSIKLRQDVLSASGGTTRVFDWFGSKHKPVYMINTEERVGKCGRGYETSVEEYRRRAINVPLMMGCDFKIDNPIKCGKGISGGNFWLLCDNIKTARKAGRASIEAIKEIDEVITSFKICPSGSTAENYLPIGPPTNYLYCPTLKERLGVKSKVPKGVKSIPEIVIDGASLPAVKNAMKKGIAAASKIRGVKIISAGNYKGKVGNHKIYLKDLVLEELFS